MEKLKNSKPAGISGTILRVWGMLFLAAGIVSRSILQNRMLGVGTGSIQVLLEGIETTPGAMAIATVALVLQAVETCALPIFAWLLVSGFQHTKSGKMYLLRLAGLALLTELPYNLAMGGKLLDMSSRNPVFGLMLALVMLYFCRRYEGAGFKNLLIKGVVILAAVLWCSILRIDHGVPLVVVSVTLWLLRKTQLRAIGGAVAAMACCLVSPFYLASSMGCLPVHLYNGERGLQNRWANYLAYPVLLLVVALVVKFAI